MIKIPERKIKRLLSFSGGRTSGLMLRKQLDLNPNFNQDFKVCFCNTGKERNETLDFVHEIETRWNVPVVWLEYQRVPANTISPEVFPTKKRQQNHLKIGNDLTHWFKIVDYETAARNGEPFNEFLSCVSALPNVIQRSCSAQLKIRTAIRYLFSIGWNEFECYIGIRKDEEHRAIQIMATCENFLHPKFPLIDDLTTVQDVNKFWKESVFDLNLKSYEGNCDLCFLKAVWKRKAIMRDRPSCAKWWIEKESDGKHGDSTFRIGEKYEDVFKSATHPELNLFNQKDEDIPCSCAEKGFCSNDED